MKKSVIVKGERGTCPIAGEKDRIVCFVRTTGKNRSLYCKK